MKNMFLYLFGHVANQIVIVEIEEVEYYLASQICQLLGLGNVDAAMRCNSTRNLMNLDRGDRFKMKLDDNSDEKYWFITEEGFWKLLWKSNSFRLQVFKLIAVTNYLPKYLRTIAVYPNESPPLQPSEGFIFIN